MAEKVQLTLCHGTYAIKLQHDSLRINDTLIVDSFCSDVPTELTLVDGTYARQLSDNNSRATDVSEA